MCPSLFLYPAAIFALTMSLLIAPASAQGACWTVETLTSTPNDDLDAQWSPDGKYIAFVGHHEGSPDVYLLDVATRQIRNLSNLPQDDFQPRWSPDGRYLTYLRRSGAFLTQTEVWLFTLATGQVERINEMRDDIHAIAWLPDGNTLRFASSRVYFTYDVNQHKLREMSVPKVSRLRAFPAPDSRFVGFDLAIYSYNLKIPSSYWVELLDTETGQQEPVFDQDFGLNLPAWSPDSRRLAFVQDNYPDAGMTLNLYDRLTHQLQALQTTPNGGLSLPRWSPDGRLAWVVSRIEQVEPQVIYHTYLFVSADPDQPPRELLNLYPGVGNLAWSPTRDQLAFQTYAGVYIADVPSGVFHEFVQGLGVVNKIVWSPDGNYLATKFYDFPIVKYYDVYHTAVITDIRTGVNFIYGPFPDHFLRGEAQWSPDSHHLLLSSGPWGNTDLVMLSACEEQP